MKAVRVLAALAVLAACDPAVGSFRPRPVRAQPSCGVLPALPPDQPADAFPRFEDLDGDTHADYIVKVPATCDVNGSCDHVLFVIRESCVLEVGRVHAAEIDFAYFAYSGRFRELTGLERADEGGAPALRKTRWRYEQTAQRYVPGSIVVCTRPPRAPGTFYGRATRPGPVDEDSLVYQAKAFTECSSIESEGDPPPPASPTAPGGPHAH
jgi:hypothetical protein